MVLLAMDGALRLLVPITILLTVAWLGHGLARSVTFFRLRPRWTVAWWRTVAVALVLFVISTHSPLRIPIAVPASTFAGIRPASASSACESTSANLYAEHRVDVHSGSSDQVTWPHSAALLDDSPNTLDHAESSFQHASKGQDLGSTVLLPESATTATAIPASVPILVVMIWSIGALVGFGRWCLAACVLRLRAKISRPVSEYTLRRASKIAAKLGYVRRLNLRIADVPTPCVLGLIRPAILLPRGIAALKHRPEFEVAVAHEVAHLQHRDLIWDATLRAISIVGWIHPLLWCVTKVHRTACERVSDLTAADAMANRELYAATLARLALALNGRPSRAIAFGLAVHCDILDRLSLLRSCGHARRLNRTAKAILCAWPLVCLFLGLVSMSPALKADPPPVEQTTAEAPLASPVQAESNWTSSQPPHSSGKSNVRLVPIAQATIANATNANATQIGAATPPPSLYDIYRHAVQAKFEDGTKESLPELTGRVLRASQQPAPGVLVVLIGMVRQKTYPYLSEAVLARTETDANGQYRFEPANYEVPRDVVVLNASLVRILALSKENEFAEAAALTRVSDSLQPVTQHATLPPLRPMVTGEITFVAPDGSPIVDANVHINGYTQLVESPSNISAWHSYPNLPGQRTDAAGKSKLPFLPADALIHLSVKHPDWAPASVSAHTAVDRTEEWRRTAIAPMLENAQKQLKLLAGRNDRESAFLFEIGCNELKSAIAQPLTMLKVTADSGLLMQGKVVCAETGAPVPARLALPQSIYVRWPFDAGINTDQNGNFKAHAMTLTPDQRQYLDVTRIKVTPLASQDYLPARMQVELASLDKLELKVHRAIPVSGQIITRGDQTPLAKITVAVTSETVGDYSSSCDTDSDGRFQLLVPAGKFQLTAKTNVPGIDLPRGPNFPVAESISRPREKTTVIFEGNATLNSEVNLGAIPVNRTRLLDVLVQDPAGKPVAGAIVKLHRTAIWRDRDGQMVPSQLMPFSQPVTTNAQGLCQLRPDTAEPLEYVLVATWEHAGQVYRATSHQQFLPEGLITLRMQAAGRFTGRVTHNGQPLVGVALHLEEVGDIKFPTGLGVSITGGVLQNIDQVASQSDGSFRFIVQRGKQYRVMANHPTRFNQVSSTSLTIEGSQPDQANIDFISGNEKLSGQVQMVDGSPVAGASVYLMTSPGFNPNRLYYDSHVRSDDTGRFQLDHLPAGNYRVQAVYYQPDRKTSFEAQVELTTGERDHVVRLKKR